VAGRAGAGEAVEHDVVAARAPADHGRREIDRLRLVERDAERLQQRVVGAGGKILLSGEHGFEQRLCLQHEGVRLIGLRVDMKNHHHSFFAKKKSAASRKAAKRSSTGKRR
jgi:alkylated DNA nucleotide flippase Atl1